MPKKMTSRERVLAALHHQEPDRVPTALWGSYYTLQDETYLALLRHLGLGDPVPPFRRFKTKNSNYHDDRILDALGVDIRYVWLGFTDLGGANPNTMIDAWGVQYRRVGPHVYAVGPPLADATVEQVHEYPWPDPERYITPDLLRQRLRAFKRTGSHAIAARAVSSYGPFEQSAALRGREQFLMDLLLQPEVASLLVEKVTDVLVRLTETLLDIAGHDLDIIEIPGDDFAGENNLIISPAAFDRFFKPAMARIIEPIKRYRSDLFVAFHSDGAIAPLLNRFIDLGIDLFHPLEPIAANDIESIKGTFGSNLAFMGAIDVRTAMTGSIADVEAEVRKRIDQLAPSGGYILAPANHLQPDVPPENIVALFHLART